MRIEWVILAEGFGMASSGALTAIGLNQNLIIATTLPTMAKRAVLAHVTAGDGSLADSELGVAIEVIAPSGQRLVNQTGVAKAGPPLWPDLPVSVDIFTEFPVDLHEYGTYSIAVKITGPDGTEATGEVSFHVHAPR